MSLLTVKNIHAGYRNKNIIRDINFVVDRGEIIALLGLNGTGKTTLLKVISGLIKPQEGVCLIGDRLISQLKERERARRIYISRREIALSMIPRYWMLYLWVLRPIYEVLNPPLNFIESMPISHYKQWEWKDMLTITFLP